VVDVVLEQDQGQGLQVKGQLQLDTESAITLTPDQIRLTLRAVHALRLATIKNQAAGEVTADFAEFQLSRLAGISRKLLETQL